MDERYLCVGGWVTSISDGQRHFVSGRRLVDLYRLRMNQIIFIGDEEEFERLWGRGQLAARPDAVVLRPDESGRYQLPSRRPAFDTGMLRPYREGFTRFITVNTPASLAPNQPMCRRPQDGTWEACEESEAEAHVGVDPGSPGGDWAAMTHLLQRTPEVAEAVQGMNITTVRWEERGGRPIRIRRMDLVTQGDQAGEPDLQHEIIQDSDGVGVLFTTRTQRELRDEYRRRMRGLFRDLFNGELDMHEVEWLRERYHKPRKGTTAWSRAQGNFEEVGFQWLDRRGDGAPLNHDQLMAAVSRGLPVVNDFQWWDGEDAPGDVS